MEYAMIGTVEISYDELLSSEEVTAIAREEIKSWKEKGDDLVSITMTLDGDDIVVKTVKKPRIRRTRRICGYCSNTANWGQHKLDELADRKTHV